MSAPQHLKIGLLGASGRMGLMVQHLLKTEYANQAQLAVLVSSGETLTHVIGTDVVIDFSVPEAVDALVTEVLSRKTGNLPAFVFGSTGWKVDLMRKVDELAQRTMVLISSNFSVGILVLQEALKAASPVLEKMGFTPIIVEAHHTMKRDLPSGTALSLQRVVATSAPGNIQTHSIRAAGIIGEHDVTFYRPGESVTFKHQATDRSIFARGAIEAAIWIGHRRSIAPSKFGTFTMEHFYKDRFLRQ